MKIQICLVILMALLSKRSSAAPILSGILQLNLNNVPARRIPSSAARYPVPAPRFFFGLLPVQYPFFVSPPTHFPTLNLQMQPLHPSAPGLPLLPPYPLYR